MQPTMNPCSDALWNPHRLVAATVTALIRTEDEDAIFVLKDVADRVGRDLPDRSKLRGCEVLFDFDSLDRHRHYLLVLAGFTNSIRWHRSE